jgi:hypothetical protein
MLERDIEAHLVEGVKCLGGVAYKFTSPGRRNVPDRICVLPRGVVFFVELKASGKKPTAGQLREHQRLRDLGQPVFVCDSLEQVDTLLSRWCPLKATRV